MFIISRCDSDTGRWQIGQRCTREGSTEEGRKTGEEILLQKQKVKRRRVIGSNPFPVLFLCLDTASPRPAELL